MLDNPNGKLCNGTSNAFLSALNHARVDVLFGKYELIIKMFMRVPCDKHS